MKSPDRELEWTALMIAAIDGDEGAYRRLLTMLTPVIRATAVSTCRRYTVPLSEAEDAVQETLIAIHLKRHTWRRGEPVGPWMNAIVRNKLIDAFRRRTRRAEIDIDAVVQIASNESDADASAGYDAEKLLTALSERDRSVVRLVSIEGHSMRETGFRLGISEGATRVALHRALKKIRLMLQKDEK